MLPSNTIAVNAAGGLQCRLPASALTLAWRRLRALWFGTPTDVAFA